MKISFITAVWQRPEVFMLFTKGMARLIQDFPKIDISVVVVGSEGQKSQSMVRAEGYHYIEYPNDPLSIKMQSTVSYAQKMIDPDYYFCLGSDDIIHPKLFKEYLRHAKKGVDYIGCLDWYFHDIFLNKSSYWGGYIDARRKGLFCGAGRMISRNLLDKMDGVIWKGNDMMLDTSMEERMKSIDYTSHAIHLKSKKLYGLDIKSAINMTKFDLWDNTKYIDNKIIFKQFSYVWH
jgi:hypothetical protein